MGTVLIERNAAGIKIPYNFNAAVLKYHIILIP